MVKKKWLHLMLFVVIVSVGFVCTVSCTGKCVLFGLDHDDIKYIRENQIERKNMINRGLFMHESVIFGLNKSVLSFSAKSLLDRKIAWLNENPNVKVIVEGHCDSLGNESYNLVLGKKRASVVMSYMVDNGIEGPRMSVVSYGEKNLVDCGKSEEESVKNRRVRFSVVD